MPAMQTTSKFLSTLAGVCLAFAATAAHTGYDPPGRVARLSYVSGEVSFSPAGERQWYRAMLNRPHARGDRLWTDRRSRAELQLGGAVLRLDEYTSVELLNLDDRDAQVELTEGTLNLRVRRAYAGQEYEIATPTLALVIDQPGDYRIEVGRRGQAVTVVVWDGEAVAYGEGSSFPLRDGDAVEFYDAALRDYEFIDYPQPDEFDRFCDVRDRRLDRAVALRYVPDELIGYDDLDDYGRWSTHAEYGAVWFPTRVAAGWAPYRYGRWIWQDPWGWTWIDDAPWGFAPFHYGRWAFVDRRWCWVPGPRRARAVYAPALVAFVGGRDWSIGISAGASRPVGWFPLGPREVYVPAYQASREYFTQVNINNTVINNTYITNVYNDYSRGRPWRGGEQFMHRRTPEAITAVPGDVFVNSRPVDRAMLRMSADSSVRAEVLNIAALAPVQTSVVGAAPAAAKPAPEIVDRRVIAREAPPPAPAPFEARREALQRNPGKPLAIEQIEPLRPRGRDAMPAPQVRVVGESERSVREEPFEKPAEAGRRERDGGAARSEVERDQRQREREVERERRQDLRELEQQGQPDPRQAERDRQAADQQREAERQQREVQRQQEQQQREAEREQEREQERQQERQQRDMQREQDVKEQQQREAERAQREQERQQRDTEQQREMQRQQQEQQREAERAQREQERRQREAEQQQREADQQRRELEQQQREMERQQRELEQQQQREAERQQREYQQQQREAERAQRETEREQRQQEPPSDEEEKDRRRDKRDRDEDE
jgi:DNA segregation ATPase FtsK/SpoIIIE-like protein